MSRYKFVSKMLAGSKNVLEIGCGDGFCSKIVSQEVESMLLTDIDSSFVEEAEKTTSKNPKIRTQVHNIIDCPLGEVFDAAYSLDVLEHVSPTDQDRFLLNTCLSLKRDGVLIL